MSREYPRIGTKRKPKLNAHPNNGNPCIVCGTKTTGRVDIQVSYMRGDDEVEPVCGDCQKGPEPALLEKIVAVWRSQSPKVKTGEPE